MRPDTGHQLQNRPVRGSGRGDVDVQIPRVILQVEVVVARQRVPRPRLFQRQPPRRPEAARRRRSGSDVCRTLARGKGLIASSAQR